MNQEKEEKFQKGLRMLQVSVLRRNRMHESFKSGSWKRVEELCGWNPTKDKS